MLEFPSIRCVGILPIEELYVSANVATYNYRDNVIWITHRHRWSIFHELGHWWGHMQKGKRHWIHAWLDKPKGIENE